MTDYWKSTRHPWASLIFLLPLLLVYEGGILWLGGTRPEAIRNGADSWLRLAFLHFGLTAIYIAPAFIVALLLAWSWWRQDDCPSDITGVCSGMGIECVLFALMLWVLSRNMGYFLERMGIVLDNSPSNGDAVAQVITYIGAGIYEELLFRLLLFSLLVILFRIAGLPGALAALVSAVVGSVLFSAAHNIGPYGEPFDRYVFLFRALAGLYFTLVYWLRGFGVAVGAHALYDVVVGVKFG